MKGHYGDIAIEVAYASKFSLYANPIEKSFIPFNTTFDTLVVQTANGSLKFGRCTFLPSGERGGHKGRLVFHGDIYNFDHLFREEALFDLEKSFQNLPLAIAQKAMVRQTFKDFTSELTYEMNVYKSFFDDLDQQIKREPQAVQHAARQSIIDSEGRKFLQHFSEWLKELRTVTRDFTREQHEQHGFYFRKQVWHIVSTSRFLYRTNAKPRGYAGDSEMMSMLYANAYEGSSTFGQLLHKHPVESAAAQAVRNRRVIVPAAIESTKAETKPNEVFRVMSVACGPALELSDLLSTTSHPEGYEFVLLDQDVDALSEAAASIGSVERAVSVKANVTYLNESVRTMLRMPELSASWGKFDYIYSMGLFDYLSKPVATAVAKKLFELLYPGGELLIGNYHAKNPTRTYMEYWMDWVLLYRTEDDLYTLANELQAAEADVFFENTGSQMFLKLRKS